MNPLESYQANPSQTELKVIFEPWTLIDDSEQDALARRIVVTALLFIVLLPILMFSVSIYALHKHFSNTPDPKTSPDSSDSSSSPASHTTTTASSSSSEESDDSMENADTDIEEKDKNKLPTINEDDESFETSSVSSSESIYEIDDLEINPSIDDIKSFWCALYYEMSNKNLTDDATKDELKKEINDLQETLDIQGLTIEQAQEMFTEWLNTNDLSKHDNLTLFRHTKTIPLQPSQLTSIKTLFIPSDSPFKDDADFIDHFPNLERIVFTGCDNTFDFPFVLEGIDIKYEAIPQN